MAAIGAGLTDDFSGVSRFIGNGELIRPNPDNSSTYEVGYQRFRATYGALVSARESN
jgi:xylulokinase